MYRLLVLLFIILTCGCKNHERKLPIIKADSTIVNTSEPFSADSLITYFIQHTDNKEIQFRLQNNKSITWIFDDNTITDTACYTTYRIGHDETDEDGTSLRFATDAWVYIDTVKRKLYEYDVIGDSLK